MAVQELVLRYGDGFEIRAANWDLLCVKYDKTSGHRPVRTTTGDGCGCGTVTTRSYILLIYRDNQVVQRVMTENSNNSGLTLPHNVNPYV